jgi:hypothetical protein
VERDLKQSKLGPLVLGFKMKKKAEEDKKKKANLAMNYLNR